MHNSSNCSVKICQKFTSVFGGHVLNVEFNLREMPGPSDFKKGSSATAGKYLLYFGGYLLSPVFPQGSSIVDD
jgi:hypothetical protein